MPSKPSSAKKSKSPTDEVVEAAVPAESATPKKEVKEVTEEQHRLTTNEDTVKWFRRLGGSETVTRGYTYAGYVVVKLVSTSPDKDSKTVREYKFKNAE